MRDRLAGLVAAVQAMPESNFAVAVALGSVLGVIFIIAIF
jgi:hypothetical protein